MFKKKKMNNMFMEYYLDFETFSIFGKQLFEQWILALIEETTEPNRNLKMQ